MLGLRKIQTRRIKSGLVTLLFVLSQASSALAPFIITNTAVASPTKITAKDHEGQKSDLSYTGGNITQYTEGDFIEFRFDLEATHGSTTGQVEVRFTGDDGTCKFFDGSFALGSVTTTGPAPTVTTSGTPVAQDFGTSSGEWVQTLNVSYPTTFSHTSNEAVVNYTLRLSNEAGECTGSSQHSRLNPAGGTLAQTGEQNVPVPANQIIELPEIFIQKWVDTNFDGVVDRRATEGEWSFSLNGATPVATNANGEVVFTNVTPNGNHLITESNGPAGQSFLSGSGTYCVFSGSTATATVQSGTTSSDATCIFNNAVQAGTITIKKNAVPNDAQDFAFTTTGSGTSNFSLDDDADGTLSDTKLFSNLTAGTYTFTEANTPGWYLDAIDCPNISETQDVNGRNVSLTITAGQNITCTFTNRKLGQIIVTKQTDPNNDPTLFSITASPAAGIVSPTPTQPISDNQSVTYTVKHGTYNVTEAAITGWAKNDSQCQGLVINGNTPLVNGIPTRSCTINNTKLATLNIIKDALPNDAQDFNFTTSNLGGAIFNLDDDTDATLPNQQTFNNLTPGQTYSVTEQSLAGWSLTGLSCNDVSQIGSTATVTPTAGQVVTCTFTNTKLRSISGIKYTTDADSGLGPVLSGWMIYIDSNNNGIQDQGELSDVTDQNGEYSFLDLLPGNYILKEILLAGWTQIFGPAPVDLTYNADSTGNNFGNFQNGSISGFKWNDRNANDIVDDGEVKPNGWTITIYDEQNNALDTDVTDSSGDYSFTNLAPGTYSVCETPQAGWVQTYPNDNSCHVVTINESGETNEANFGNQGRGTILVNKNVDTNGDGQVDEYGVADWTWDIDGGQQDTATGTSQNVAAGTYDINEDQKDGYNVTDLTCGSQSYGAVEAGEVTVDPGDSISCTFTNTRDTGTIEVIKNINPDDDNGLFDLQINGTVEKEDASDGDTTGAVQVVTGTYDVGEIAGDSTDLSDYSSSLTCTKNGQSLFTDVSTTDSDNFEVDKDDVVVCIFTNVRYGHIIIEKQTLPDGNSQSFSFDSSYDDGFNLTDNQQNDSGNLLPDTYSVSEAGLAGWDLTSATCDDDQSAPDSISLQAGETVTCTFTNTKRTTVVVTKFNDYNQNGEKDDDEPMLSGWDMTLEHEAEYEEHDDYEYLKTQTTGKDNNPDGVTTFTDVKPGEEHTLSETIQEGWNWSNTYCEYQNQDERGYPNGNNSYELYVSPGDSLECFVGNYQDPGLNIAKSNDKPNTTITGDTVTYTLVVTVPEDKGVLYDTTVQDLPPENFEYVPGSWTANSNFNGDIKGVGVTEPTYASPGKWLLGRMLPGEVITLTYKAKILSNVTNGIYPDIAFAVGNSATSARVLSNVSTGASTPFVGTQVSVDVPQPPVVLVNTGAKDVLINTLIGASLMVAALATLVRRQKKGVMA